VRVRVCGDCMFLLVSYKYVIINDSIQYICMFSLYFADVNTCRSHPCMNGGTCHSLFDAYKCDCVDGFSGDVCDSRKYLFIA